MAVKDNFSAEEWSVLTQAPFCAALAVIVASPSGPIGALKELFAMGSILGDAAREGGASPIVQAVVEDLRENPNAGKPSSPPTSAPEAKSMSISGCRRVAALLASKVPASEADAFKRWLRTLSQKVAEASNEGGLFGIGGVKVSEAEQVVLKDIENALGMTG